MLPNVLYVFTITLTSNPNRDTTSKESDRPLFLMQKKKFLNKIIAIELYNTLKEFTGGVPINISIWKTIFCFLKRLKLELPSNPAVFGRTSRELHTLSQRHLKLHVCCCKEMEPNYLAINR